MVVSLESTMFDDSTPSIVPKPGLMLACAMVSVAFETSDPPEITQTKSGWWFGTFFLIFHIVGIIIPIDEYFSEGLKPPTRKLVTLQAQFQCTFG